MPRIIQNNFDSDVETFIQNIAQDAQIEHLIIGWRRDGYLAEKMGTVDITMHDLRAFINGVRAGRETV